MIGARIHSLVKSKRISINQIAEKLNITNQQVYNIFKKKHIDSSYLFQFAEILDVSPDVLLMGADGGDFSTRAVSELQKEIAQLKKRIAELEEQLADKNQVLDFMNRESLLTYSVLIQVLSETQTRKNNDYITNTLGALSRSRIFDPDFLQKLLDMDYITDEAYQFFISAKEKK
jgi:transcriptional regulator with XRE-family HTH domain